MGVGITIDDSDFQKKSKAYEEAIKQSVTKAVSSVGHEILRLSQYEVPHDTGMLQNSGHVEEKGNHAMVGYNKVYAARLHEHPEYKFRGGRKGKYLEDPIKRNLRVFQDFFKKAIHL